MTIESKQPFFAHTNKLAKDDNWKTVDVQKLPSVAYAVVGDTEDSKTWKYPHHAVDGAGQEDEHGRYTRGELVVSMDGLKSALKDAEKDGDKSAIDHLNIHRKTLDPDMDGHPLPNRTGLNAYFEEKTVPRYSFSAPAVLTVGDNGFGAVSAPIQLVALSGEILERPEWGACIQDLTGLEHKDRIAIDYRHNPDEVVGYINRFEVVDGKLVLGGALVPQKTHKRTEEIIDNMKSGVPYEASIYFPPWKPDEMGIEVIEEGETAEVNGKTITAPAGGLTIFRRWQLRGCAICPHGADGNTAVYLQEQTVGQVTVQVHQLTKENKMKVEEIAKENAELKKSVEAFEQAAKEKLEAEAKVAQEAAAVEAGKKKEEEEKAKDGEGDGRELFKKMHKKFGAEMAGKYYAAGKSYEEALEMFADECRKQLEQAAEEEDDKEEQKGKQSASKKIKFQQSEVGASGLTAAEEAHFAAYAQANGWDEAKLAKMKAYHPKAKLESMRCGLYSPDAKAQVGPGDGGTLTKVGVEQ